MYTYIKNYTKKMVTYVILILIIIFCMYVTGVAQESIKVYNKGEEVSLSHELFYYNDLYYMHLDDLKCLGLSINKADGTYTITSNDCLGIVRKIVIKPVVIYDNDDIEIITPIDGLISTNEADVSVHRVSCSGTYWKRATEKIGYLSESVITSTGGTLAVGSDGMIYLNNEYYVSTKFVGGMLSHEYSFKNNRIDFYMSDSHGVITEATLNLVRDTFAPSDGHNVNIYTAYKVGDGDTLGDFEILSAYSCTIQESKNSVSCLIETPADKVNDKNIYFIADLGERYMLVYNEFDFSVVGNIQVYGQQKDVTYTVDVNLPEADEVDVLFTVYVIAKPGGVYSTQGIIKSGEKSANIQLCGLPLASHYKTSIEFDCHKYKNAYLKDIYFSSLVCARDFESDFNAEYSKEVICTVSLPDGYVSDGDVEVELSLSKYTSDDSLSIFDELTDWEDNKTINLNNEKRTEQVYLYTQTNSAILTYKINNDVDGLCAEGYLRNDAKATGNKDLSKKITDDFVANFSLLRCKNITVDVFRPFALSLENDVFAEVEVYEGQGENSIMQATVIDYTQTPLISKGERTSQFQFEIAEDKVYKLRITNISGDDRLFDYYHYVQPLSSPSETSKLKLISFNDDNIHISLLQCNTVSGSVECEESNLKYVVTASCNLYNGNTIKLQTEASDGKFSLKVPEDTDTYTLDVQTKVGEKSYYVSDGVSSDLASDATHFIYEYNDDNNVTIEYIIQNPTIPIEISVKSLANNDYFEYSNISDFLINNASIYLAYYTDDGKLISIEKEEKATLPSGYNLMKRLNKNNNYKIKRIKCFIWKDDMLSPLSNISELCVNKPDIPEPQDMPFNDIEYDDLYFEATSYMYHKGVFVRYEDGSFKPEETVLRSEASMYISRTMGHEFREYDFCCSDVAYNHWAKSWIGICINEGVFELENNKFRPDDCITVEETVTAILKMKDTDLETAKEIGLLANINYDNATRNITRGELAQLFYNAVK